MENATQNNKSKSVLSTSTSRIVSPALATVAKRLGLLAITVGLAAGCTDRVLTVDPRTGVVTYKSKRFGNMEKFDKIVVQSGTNRIEIQGYTSDQVALAEKVAGAVAKGVTEGMKP